jgi:hypothetical protein
VDKLAEVKKAEKHRQSSIRQREADIVELEKLLTIKPPKMESEEELADQLVRMPIL